MPYTGPDDASLPANVKKLPAPKRAQWVKVFNDAMKSNKPEAAAFAMANGMASKELGEAEEHVHGEKCGGGCDYAPPPIQLVQEVEEPPPPLGGATSFAEYDVYDEAQDLDNNVREMRYVFNDICSNVWRDENLTLAEKGTKIAQAAQDLASRIAAGPQGQKSFLARAKEFFAGSREKTSPAKQDNKPDSAIWVTADKETGAPRWFAVHSNRYEDREGEVFPEKAHKAYEAYVDRTHDYPELRGWHVPGSRIGKADFVGYVDGFMTSSGTFDPGMEYVAENIKALNEEEPQGVSHGYFYPEEGLIDGIYEGGYRTHEITILPLKNTSNWWGTALTNVKAIQEVIMAGYTAEKQAYLDRLLGPEKRKAVEKNLKELGEVLDGSGVGMKEITEAFASKDAPAAVAEAPPANSATPVEGSVTTVQTAAAVPEKLPGEELPKDSKADGEESVAEKAIGGIVERALATALQPVMAQQSVMATAIKELQRSDDEKVADTIAGKKATNLDAPRPTGTNEISAEQAAEKGIDPKDDPSKLADMFGDSPVGPYLSQLVGGARVPISQ